MEKSIKEVMDNFINKKLEEFKEERDEKDGDLTL